MLPSRSIAFERMAQAQPKADAVDVDEVAELAVFLAGDAARHIDGVAIPVSRGWISS